MSSPNQIQQHSESFYSIYSHESILDSMVPYTIRKQQQQYEYAAHTPQPPLDHKMIKIAQSNINLDDAFQGSVSEERDYETLGKQYPSSTQIYRNTNIIQQVAESQQKFIEPEQDISGISYRQEAKGDMSVCLLKQIDCLSFSQVSPEQLRQIKKKIQLLKKQQFAMQSSLLMANQLLSNAQSRNNILQQQIETYKSKQKFPTVPTSKIIQSKSVTINSERRTFPQQCKPPIKNDPLDKLKILYKECSFNQSFCVYQNEGYKIEAIYQRNRDGLALCVKLTPHHHIANKKTFRFGLQLSSSPRFDPSTLSYDGSMLIQQYFEWTQNCFQVQVIIHELDQVSNKHHNHAILVPLPLSHFLQPRLLFCNEEQIRQIKNTISQYTLSFNGASKIFVEKLKEMWWIGRFVSTLRGKQMILIDFINHQEQKAAGQQMRIKVYGKIGSKLVTGAIEFLTFLLTP